MATLRDVLDSVKDKSLSKEQLEDFHIELTHLFTAICLEASELKKKEALYFLEHTKSDVSDVSIKRLWRGTEEGQRLLTLEAYRTIIPKELTSLKNRIYSKIF